MVPLRVIAPHGAGRHDGQLVSRARQQMARTGWPCCYCGAIRGARATILGFAGLLFLDSALAVSSTGAAQISDPACTGIRRHVLRTGAEAARWTAWHPPIDANAKGGICHEALLSQAVAASALA